ncbi:MAG: AAA family ATPase, partial [Bacteroidota bacterium]
MQRLDLSSIAIRTFYGHPLPGVAAQDIGPGVNVIYGPNGQGKTTLARAIHGVLWPETVEAARPTYTASFHYGGDAWDVHFDSGSPRYHCNGEPADRLPLPDPSYRDRYELSLSDLLVEDGESFADLVRRDAAGGVDLGEARQRLGLIAAPTQRLKATAEAEDAARSVQRRQHALDALRAREQALGEIAERAAEATDATELAELYRLLDDAADREDEVRAAESVVAEFDPALASVAPDTQERYDDLSAAVRKAESRLEDAEASRASARAALADHGWDDVAIPEAAELRARHAELETATRVVEAAESARSTASEREDRARLALGGHIDIAPTVDISALGDVAAFARRAGQVEGRAVEYQARRDAAKARLNAIRFHDADELSRAADLLRQWLAHTSEAERRPVLLAPTPVWVAAGVCAVLGVVGLFLGRLGSGWMYAGMAALGAAFALVPVAIRLGRDVEPPASPADAAREQVGVLAVLGPETWDAPTVQRTLDRVERQLLDQKERT